MPEQDRGEGETAARSSRRTTERPRRKRRGWARRAPWWEVAGIVVAAAGILIAIVGAGVAIWQTIETRRANTEQLTLFREQLELDQLAARPILVPIAGEQPLADPSGALRFKIRNAANAPALGGTIVVQPVGSPKDEPPSNPFPSCAEHQAAIGHAAFQVLPPVAPGETITVQVESDDVPFELSTSVVCATAWYEDTIESRFLTDWIWNREVTVLDPIPPDFEERREQVWTPRSIELVDDQDPEWWEWPEATGRGVGGP